MSSSAQDAARRHVYRRFPALKGVKPVAGRAGPHLVYTFKQSQAGPPGTPSVRQIVRVTVTEGGEIVKVVASKG